MFIHCCISNQIERHGYYSVTTSSRAFSYIRFSTPEQQNGDSFRRQYELSKVYAESHGLILDERLTYRDLGVSAFDKSNLRDGQLGAFLKAIESGAVPAGSYLLVESLDRISRAQITDALEIFMSILNRGITIVTFADGMEYSKEKANKQFTDFIISIAIMSRAHEESLTKSRRLKETWITKRANLDQRKLTAIAPGWLELSEDKSRFLLVPHRVKLVQEIFEWSKNGLGAEAIAKRLNQKNVPTFGSRAKNTWHTSYIKKILGNKSVLGEFQPHVVVGGNRIPEGEPITDYFPRIISDEDFLLTTSSQQSRRNNGAGRKGVGISNLFSGVVRCGYCHGPMVYLNKGHTGPRAKLLVCSSAKAGKGCMYIPWEYTYFEQSVLTYCRGLDVENFLQLPGKAKSELTQLEEKIVVLKASLLEIESKESNILEAIEAGAKYQQFEVRARQLAQERTHAEFELRSVQTKYEQHASVKIDIKMVRSTIEEFLAQMNQLSGEALYDMRSALSQQIKRIIARIAMYPGGYVEKPKYIAALRDHLVKKGYDQNEVAEHIAATHKITPNPTDRYFVMVSHNASIRMIKPSLDNPEVMNIEMPEEDPMEHMKLYAEGFGGLMERFKEIALKKENAENNNAQPFSESNNE
jgi:DNA invertase Pin-like site-specific DNA recombinase/ElaB/YqjD/DUF883 family membrane-anchored ribosome-binding protein